MIWKSFKTCDNKRIKWHHLKHRYFNFEVKNQDEEVIYHANPQVIDAEMCTLYDWFWWQSKSCNNKCNLGVSYNRNTKVKFDGWQWNSWQDKILDYPLIYIVVDFAKNFLLPHISCMTIWIIFFIHSLFRMQENFIIWCMWKTIADL